MAADGILLLSEPDEPGYVARLRIFNPDGSEAELSGNGAREAVMYLRRHDWTDARLVHDPDRGRATSGREITSATECTVDMGRATVSEAPATRRAPRTAAASSTAAGRTWRFQHVQVGNPQCAIRVERRARARTLDLRAIGPGIEHHELFPNRTNVSWFAELDDSGPGRGYIRARIFERGVGETSASGTGATGAAVAYVLDRGTSPVTVVLDGGELAVEVGDETCTSSSRAGRSRCSGARSPTTFLEELHATK